VRAARTVMREAAAEALTLARASAPSRSGRLARSLKTKPIWRNAKGEAGFHFTSNHPAARILEMGGRVVPRSVSLLAVPLRGQTVWPRHSGGRHIVIKARSGRLYLFAARPRDGGTPLWELRRSVDIQARPYLRPAVRRVTARILRDLPSAVIKA